MFRGRPLRRTAVAALIALSALTSVPVLAGTLLSPAGTVTATSTPAATATLHARGIDTSALRIETVAGMRVAGQAANGYVDMWSGPDVIRMRPDVWSTAQYTDNVLHEFGHVAQKRLVDRVAGGRQWWSRTLTIAELDRALRAVSPPVDAAAAPTLTPGLEADADCIAVALSSRLYRPWYVRGSSACTGLGLAAARSVLEGDWPSTANVARRSTVLAAEARTASATGHPSS